MTIVHDVDSEKSMSRKDIFIGLMILILSIILGIIGLYILYQFISGVFDAYDLLILLFADLGLWFTGMTILAMFHEH